MSDMPPPPPGAAPPVVPADWYAVGDVLRYWNGTEWTHHTSPLPQAVPPPPNYGHQAPAPMPQHGAGPLMSFTSHIAGRNAQVAIFQNRVEWTRGGFGRSQGTETIPIRNITSVTTKKDGMMNWAVSIITSGNTIDMRVSKPEAERAKSILLSLML